MAYTFGDFLNGGSNAGDPRNGMFSTGAEYDTGARAGQVVWPNNAPAPTLAGFGSVDTSRPNSALGFDLGTPVNSLINSIGLGSSARVDLDDFDGNAETSFRVADLQKAIFSTLGLSDGRATATPAMGQAYPAQTQDAGQIAGVDIEVLAVVGLVAAGLYFALK